MMRVTTMTQVTVDGVVHGNGGASDEDRRNGFDRGGWAMGAGDHETMRFINETYQRADAFLFGRRTYGLVAGFWGAEERARAAAEDPAGNQPNYVVRQGARLFADTGPDVALDLVDARADSKGVTIQVYRPNGRPIHAD